MVHWSGNCRSTLFLAWTLKLVVSNVNNRNEVMNKVVSLGIIVL